MRDPKRIDTILARLGEVWKKYPDLRLGQLIANLGPAVYYVEDEDLIAAIEKTYDFNEKTIDLEGKF